MREKSKLVLGPSWLIHDFTAIRVVFSFWLMPWQLQALALAFYLGMIFPAHFPTSPKCWTALNVCLLYLFPPRHVIFFFQYLGVALIKSVCYLTCTQNTKCVSKRGSLFKTNGIFLEGHITQRAKQQQDTKQPVPSGHPPRAQLLELGQQCFLAETAWWDLILPPCGLLASWAHTCGMPQFLYLKSRFLCSTFIILFCLS